ncbi:MAG TPA: VWA domain-containing protein, partial [Pseudomonadales bacterium]|nr:VWA domain-containing protein [Pseudomonadales bacterium]
MLINFFYTLRNAGVPVSIKELLVLLEALENHLAFGSIDDFYVLSRACLVKDEKYFDRFDQAFGRYFKDMQTVDDLIAAMIPDDWLRQAFEKHLSDEEKKQIQSLGGLEKLIEEFKKRLEEQKERHEGGNKWIGTGGTSPFGNNGYNPEGIRVGGESKNRRAVKVWEKRQFRDLDDSTEIGSRNIKVALKRLRKFARQGAEEELDIDNTIRSTARNAGLLDIRMVPERHNAVKVLMFFDIGGSMDSHIEMCEELFSAVRTEFKHLEYFYFHNFIYDFVWKNNVRRFSEKTSTLDLMHKYAADYKVVFVGDASMAPYEITHIGGNIEYHNEEAGAVWMQRLLATYPKLVWLNPMPEEYWPRTHSIKLVRDLVENRMFPLTIAGLDQAMA